MNATHTPGPWRAEYVGLGMWAVRWAAGDVAHTAREHCPEADARLIAAAPDVLAERDALRDLLHIAYDLVVEATSTAKQYDFEARARSLAIAARTALAQGAS